MKDEHVKDAAQGVAEGVAEDVPQDVAQGSAFGGTGGAPSSPRHHRRRRRRLCAAHAEIGAQLGSSAAFGLGCRQALPGMPRKSVSMFICYRLCASLMFYSTQMIFYQKQMRLLLPPAYAQY